MRAKAENVPFWLDLYNAETPDDLYRLMYAHAGAAERAAIAQWIAVDDHQRNVHSALGYRSPLEFEAACRQREAAQAAA